jgi:phosphate transport system substrate-binding protein
MKAYLPWFLSILLIFPQIVGCQRSKAGITVAGSTSVEPFAELLAEEFMFHHQKSRIYVQGGGSSAGIEAVRTRAAHIGMSSRALKPEEKNLHAVTIAKDAIAIIVTQTLFKSFLDNQEVFSENSIGANWGD